MTMSISDLRVKIEGQIKAAQDYNPTESEKLIYGDRTEYIKGGVDALRGVLMYLDQIEYFQENQESK